MNINHALETRAICGRAVGPRRHKRSDHSVPALQAFLVASVTLSSINSPVATVLSAFLFALLAGWLKARTLPARSARAFLKAQGIASSTVGVEARRSHAGRRNGRLGSSGTLYDSRVPSAAMLRATDRSCKVAHGLSVASWVNEASTIEALTNRQPATCLGPCALCKLRFPGRKTMAAKLPTLTTDDFIGRVDGEDDLTNAGDLRHAFLQFVQSNGDHRVVFLRSGLVGRP